MSDAADREAEDKRLIMVENESLKLMAGALNSIAVPCVVFGNVAPLLAWAYNLTSAPNVSGFWLLLVAMSSFGVGAILHCAAQLILRRLK